MHDVGGFSGIVLTAWLGEYRPSGSSHVAVRLAPQLALRCEGVVEEPDQGFVTVNKLNHTCVCLEEWSFRYIP